jgi:hypothetical protein
METTMTRAKTQRAPSSEKQENILCVLGVPSTPLHSGHAWREKISRSGSVKHFKTKETKGGLVDAATQLFV